MATDFVFEVFIPNGTPTLTYVTRASEKNEQKLADALDMPRMVISISGPSKTGKTALINTCIDPERIISVSGQSIRSTIDLWQSVIRWIGGPEETEKIKHKVVKGEVGATFTAEAGILLAKAKAEGELNGGLELGDAVAERFRVEVFEAVIKELGGSDFIVFVDDFHYIDKEVQVEVARSIKAISERGVRVCIASVTHKSDDMVRANDELTGRIVSIHFNYWSVAELEIIANAGFQAMNVDIAPSVIKDLATESLGSPQLMQSLCLNLCLEKGIREKQEDTVRTEISEVDYKNALERTTLQTDYSRLVERLHTGAKERGTQRKEFQFQDGSRGDVYRSILLALMENPPRLSFDYDEVMQRVRAICVQESPVGSSVQLALNQMNSLAAEKGIDNAVLEWDEDKLEVINPYFMFYLRSSSKLDSINKSRSGMV